MYERSFTIKGLISKEEFEKNYKDKVFSKDSKFTMIVVDKFHSDVEISIMVAGSTSGYFNDFNSKKINLVSGKKILNCEIHTFITDITKNKIVFKTDNPELLYHDNSTLVFTSNSFSTNNQVFDTHKDSYIKKFVEVARIEDYQLSAPYKGRRKIMFKSFLMLDGYIDIGNTKLSYDIVNGEIKFKEKKCKIWGKSNLDKISSSYKADFNYKFEGFKEEEKELSKLKNYFKLKEKEIGNFVFKGTKEFPNLVGFRLQSKKPTVLNDDIRPGEKYNISGTILIDNGCIIPMCAEKWEGRNPKLIIDLFFYNLDKKKPDENLYFDEISDLYLKGSKKQIFKPVRWIKSWEPFEEMITDYIGDEHYSNMEKNGFYLTYTVALTNIKKFVNLCKKTNKLDFVLKYKRNSSDKEKGEIEFMTIDKDDLKNFRIYLKKFINKNKVKYLK